MRDIIWTLIILWLVFKVIAVFKNAGARRSAAQAAGHNPQQTSAEPKKDLKGALQKHLSKEGEYVDFEEIK